MKLLTASADPSNEQADDLYENKIFAKLIYLPLTCTHSHASFTLSKTANKVLAVIEGVTVISGH